MTLNKLASRLFPDRLAVGQYVFNVGLVAVVLGAQHQKPRLLMVLAALAISFGVAEAVALLRIYLGKER